jgi:7-cyano-7-deazaguanine reductase
MAKKKGPPLSKTRVPILEVFANPHPDRSYEIEIQAPEFTSVCPVTGQPDYATMLIRYIPGQACIELKSLKLYLQQYRNQGIFYEDITNRILNDLVKASSPQWMLLTSSWTPRGGISSKITVEYTGNKKRGIKKAGGV